MRSLSYLSSVIVVMVSYSQLLFGGASDTLRHSDEVHLRNIRQLTFGGTNAEAYFSFDEKRIIFQSTREPYKCDQIFMMKQDGSDQKLFSLGKGRTTCAYFLPGDKQIFYSSTHAMNDQCPPPVDKSKGYVWGVFNAYDIYVANSDGSNLKVLSASPGYDAEATVSQKGDRIVFTSSRDGDLELYTMKKDGSDIKRITFDIGYDGGAFFSWNGKRIVWRGYHPADSAEISDYKALLADQLVRPTVMEIFVGDADGKNQKQLTKTGAANFSPSFHPDDNRIIFASNHKVRRGRNFHLYLMNDDGTNLTQISYGGTFNSFPVFSRDGKTLLFVSDRNAKGSYEFNVFIAEWVE